mgnify:FL=1
MSIQEKKSYIHWNYFLALESDLAQVSRYIEFSESNYRTYSIELVRLLLAASSEVDVVIKGVCKYLDQEAQAENINDYRAIIKRELPEFTEESVEIPRFNLTLQPWSKWQQNRSPRWWKSYNNVKHERNEHFSEANLKNTLNAMGGLLVSVFYYYKLKFISEGEEINDNRDVTSKLGASLGFLTMRDDYYHAVLALE